MMEDNPRSITVAATQPTPACFQANVTTLPIICAAQKQDQKHKNRTRALRGDGMRKQPAHPQTQPSLPEGCGPRTGCNQASEKPTTGEYFADGPEGIFKF